MQKKPIPEASAQRLHGEMRRVDPLKRPVHRLLDPVGDEDVGVAGVGAREVSVADTTPCFPLQCTARSWYRIENRIEAIGSRAWKRFTKTPFHIHIVSKYDHPYRPEAFRCSRFNNLFAHG